MRVLLHCNECFLAKILCLFLYSRESSFSCLRHAFRAAGSAGSCTASGRRPGKPSCLCCGILLFDGLLLTPSGNRISRRGRIFRFGLFSHGFHVGFIGFCFQLLRLLILAELPAVVHVLHGPARGLRHAFGLVQRLDADIVIFIFGSLCMGRGRHRHTGFVRG